MDEIPISVQLNRRPFGYTYVEYVRGDGFGLVCALLSLAPALSILNLVWSILTLGSGHALILTVMGISSEIIGTILKNIIKQPRPATSGYVNAHYGMPSTHSLFAWAVGSYIVLALLRAPTFARGMDRRRRHLWAIITACAALATCYSRVYLHYHTPAQIIAGSGIGIAFGGAAYYAVEKHNLASVATRISESAAQAFFGATVQRATSTAAETRPFRPKKQDVPSSYKVK